MEIEILINGLTHITLAVLLFVAVHQKGLGKGATALLFILPVWCMFLGAYYLKTFQTGEFAGRYWRAFRIFETVTNILVALYLLLGVRGEKK